MSQRACAIGKDFIPASFKGVAFYCTEADISGGRRGAEGEFPFGENTAYADLGRKIRVYKLTAVFREDDHVSNSQALFDVCESLGPGILVHPTRGVVMAACRSISIKDNIEEAGESNVDLEFVEAEVTGNGLGGFIFGIIVTGLSAASQGSFERDYQPWQVAPPWRDEVVDTAQSLVSAVTFAAKQSLPVDASAQAWRNILKLEEVARDNALAASAKYVDRSLVFGFATIASSLETPTIASTTQVTTGGAPTIVYQRMKTLANIAVKASTVPQGHAKTSEEAVISRHRILAGVGMAQAAMTRTYGTINEVLTAMDETSSVLEDEAQAAYDSCDNALFLELRKYLTQFQRMMNDLAYRLPPIVTVDFMGGVYPLVAAYAIYNDAKRHRDLETKNIVDANGRFRPIVAAVAPQAVQ